MDYFYFIVKIYFKVIKVSQAILKCSIDNNRCQQSETHRCIAIILMLVTIVIIMVVVVFSGESRLYQEHTAQKYSQSCQLHDDTSSVKTSGQLNTEKQNHKLK